MTPYSMGVDTIVLMDHTVSTNEDHDDYSTTTTTTTNNNNNNNSLNRGSVVRRDIGTCPNVFRVTADLTSSIILKSALIV